MRRALIDPTICKSCDPCAVEMKCEQKNVVIREDRADKPWIDFNKCRGCMKCKQFCEYNAILEEAKPCNPSFMTTW
jgi:TPP-dependent indolepyruvate ferredoxin oxidoreductase alpha subunit